ncbi:MAG: serine phosphatase RsbU (regulator of sigma subunit) [Lentimonas sp.]|jgi:serine phosphatase RsbU (regulator of sigma subunit)
MDKHNLDFKNLENLKGLASYIIENKLLEFSRFQINFFKDQGKGIFALFDAANEEERLKMNLIQQETMLQSILEDRFIEKLKEDIKIFEDKIKDASFESFHFDAESFDTVVQTQKKSFEFILYPLPISESIKEDIQDEINLYYREYSYILIRSLARNKHMAFKHYKSKNDEINKALRYARTIQNSVLSSENVLIKSNINGFVINLPRDIVSGDFYFIHKTKSGTFISVADCTGHGIPAALITVLGVNLIQQSILKNHEMDPGSILNSIHENFRSYFNQANDLKESIDMSLVYLPNDRKKLIYSSANSQIYLKRNGICKLLKTYRKSIGTTELHDDFKTTTLDLESKDEVFLQSDGYRDQFGGQHGRRLKRSGYKSLLETQLGSNGEENKKIVLDFFESWKGKEEQVDDICIIGFSV